MLFNSLDFALFLPLVFLIYWALSKWLRLQNFFVLAASLYFYASWDWRFLFLLLASTLFDYSIGLALGREERSGRRKLLLASSLVFNLSLLGFFKYANFFIENFVEVMRFAGSELSLASLELILPVGISFYTFQTLSYTIDIYRRVLAPSKNFVSFAAFVSFFPQLVAGPIERATHLLPQIERPRHFDTDLAKDGLRQILWGLCKKLLIADTCAQYVDIVFAQPELYSGSRLALGALFFSFQIYGDFSGYSDIAIGTAKLLGIRLSRNFAYPYFSRDIAEFWRRWHISLSTWFRDYVYIPLGGSKGQRALRNIFLIFLLSAFWHGANWTFLAWGLLNALYFVPLYLGGRHKRHSGDPELRGFWASLKLFAQILNTFFFTSLAWVFFRADSLGHACLYLQGMVSSSLFSWPDMDALVPLAPLRMLLPLFLLIEWWGRKEEHALQKLFANKPFYWRWFAYALCILALGLYMPTSESPFLYFQF